jgi:hypothetical protein
MEISILRFKELPESEKNNQPENGGGAEWANYLKVDLGNGDVRYYSDAMEPEDARFTRDLNWIQLIIKDAYQAGQLNQKG